MKGSMKRILVFLLCAALCMGNASFAAFAEALPAQTRSEMAAENGEVIDASDEILQAGGFVSEEDIPVNEPASVKKKNAVTNAAAKTDKEAVIDLLYQGAKGWDGTSTSITVEMGDVVCTLDDIQSIFVQFINENPDLFYLTGRYRYSYYSSGIIASVTMLCDAENFTLADVTTFYSAASAILSQVKSSWSDEQKALFLHDYIVTHCEYDLTYSNYTAFHTLVTGSSVCQGYSLAYYYLLKECGIQADVISSDAMNHAWNRVIIDNQKYYTDCTWDDPTASSSSTYYQDYCGHSNFLRSQDGITETRHNSTDWVDQTGAVVYGTATGSQYEGAWWASTVTAIPHIGDLWAYAPKEDAVIYVHDYATGSDRRLAQISARWPVGDKAGYYYTDTFIHLAAHENVFYASGADQIYQIGTDGTSNVFYKLTTGEQAKGYIYGIRVEEDSLYYRLYTDTDSDCFVEEKEIALTPHTHDWGEGVITKAATCTEDGVRTYTCSVCGKTKTEEIPAAGHQYTETVVEPTCTEQGYTIHKCEKCGDEYKDSFTEALGHAYGEWVIVTEATCTEAGSRERTCERCGEKETEVIPATGHTETEDPAVEPTCTEAGKTAGSHCSVCGVVIVPQETVPAAGHQFGDWETNGEADHKHTCSVCGAEETEIHVWGEPEITKEATEYEEGLRTYTCSICGQTRTEVIPKADHIHHYTDTVVDPTCTEQGYTIHKCEKCGDEYKDTFTEALGHAYGEWVIVTEAGCTEAGSRERVCERCGEKETEVIPAAGHDWDEGTVTREATADQEGEMTYICRHCGEKRTEVIPKQDIISVIAVTVEPSKEEMATSETIKEKPYTITKASTLQLTARIEPENATNQKVKWFSSDSDIASVDENGLVTAHTYGKVTITATTEDGGKTASCQIQTRYNDVAEPGYWFNPVYWAADHNITKGYANIYFGPEENCTREQMITFLYRTADTPAVSTNDIKKYNTFSDVPGNAYYTKAVVWAAKNGITKGYSSGPNKGKFGVGLNVTREDTVTFIYRMAEKPKYSTTKSFSDVVKGKYYYDPVLWAAQNGITNGYSSGPNKGKFGVGFNVLRKDIVTFLHRYSNLK